VLDEPDSWDLGAVSRQQAIKQGLALPDLVGPTGQSIALSPKFWSTITDLECALRRWDGTAALSLSATLSSKKHSQVWELNRPLVPSLQLELLRKHMELGTYVPPKPKGKRGGRPRGDRWPEWIAHLIQYFMDRGFPQPAASEDFDLFIEDAATKITQDLDRNLTFRDGVKLDSRDTMKAVIYALRHHYQKI